MIKEVIITSGVPGSGKSTWVQNYIKEDNLLKCNYVICSADDFRIVDSQYIFNPEKEKAGIPHKECLKKFINIITDSLNNPSDDTYALDTIFVDNTNTTAMAISPYYSVASAYDIPVKIITVKADIEECIKRNVHSVPEKTIKDMDKQIEKRKFPPYWKFESIIVE